MHVLERKVYICPVHGEVQNVVRGPDGPWCVVDDCARNCEVVRLVPAPPEGAVSTREECFACHGSGKFEANADEDRPDLICAECGGTGWVKSESDRGAVSAERWYVWRCPECGEAPMSEREAEAHDCNVYQADDPVRVEVIPATDRGAVMHVPEPLYRAKPCPECGGTGSYEHEGADGMLATSKCATCDGIGLEPATTRGAVSADPSDDELERHLRETKEQLYAERGRVEEREAALRVALAHINTAGDPGARAAREKIAKVLDA